MTLKTIDEMTRPVKARVDGMWIVLTPHVNGHVDVWGYAGTVDKGTGAGKGLISAIMKTAEPI